jgi:hypothetical protein
MLSLPRGQEIKTMQGLLGTSKNNTLFYSNHNMEKSGYDVYWGFEKIFFIPDNKNSFLFKSAIAILLNAGIAAKHIEENFDISYKTIKKIHYVFTNTDDINELQEKLRTPGREEYKLNEDIRAFIVARVDYYKGKELREYNVATVRDVEEKYGVEICVETVRREYTRAKSRKVPTAPGADVNKREGEGEERKKHDARGDGGQRVFRNAYAGVLLLSAGMRKMLEGLDCVKGNLKNMVIVWLFGIVLGGKNMEQYRYLRYPDIEFVCQVNDIPGVEAMRSELKRLSVREDTELSSFFLRSTVKNFKRPGGNDFYVDGHEVEYCGKENILAGWNTKKNRVTKGYVSYFVHDSEGNPIFFMLFDHFYDFREVIRLVIPKVKKLVKGGKYTLIYDRGGFSLELMKEIGANGGKFISWEKGFNKKDIDIRFNKRLVVEFPYNDLGKTRSYTVDYHEMRYAREGFECRRIIIKREGHKGESVYQSIITSDEEASAPDVIRKILKRFLQENDFKKQKGHFGLDEITGYGKLEYNELKDKADKDALNEEYRKKRKEIFLLKKERMSLLSRLGVKYLKDLTGKRGKGLPERGIVERITGINEKIYSLREELKKIRKTVSKIEKCVNGGKVELDLRPKRILDLLKVAARNIFQSGAFEFLEVYRNLRDYQKVFRLLTRCSGEIEVQSDVLDVKLDRFGGKKFQKKCEEYFSRVNSRDITTYNGKYYLRFGWLT